MRSRRRAGTSKAYSRQKPPPGVYSYRFLAQDKIYESRLGRAAFRFGNADPLPLPRFFLNLCRVETYGNEIHKFVRARELRLRRCRNIGKSLRAGCGAAGKKAGRAPRDDGVSQEPRHILARINYKVNKKMKVLLSNMVPSGGFRMKLFETDAREHLSKTVPPRRAVTRSGASPARALPELQQ